MRILVVDIGGSHVKALATGRREPVKIPSGPNLTPKNMMTALRKAMRGWKYDVVSIGYPGSVVHGKPAEEAPNLGRGWMKFDFKKAFGRPTQVVNDAALQALGSYSGGRMLFLGLGTGLGSALILHGMLHPMEFGDLPYRNGRTFAEYLGKAGRDRLGVKSWSRHVVEAVNLLKAAVQADYTVLGGGGVKLVGRLPRGVKPGDNSKAFEGGFRLWKREDAARPSRSKKVRGKSKPALSRPKARFKPSWERKEKDRSHPKHLPSSPPWLSPPRKSS